MSSTTSVVEASPPNFFPLQVWEHVVVWIVFALGCVGLFCAPYAAGTNWGVVWELVRAGAIPLVGFAPPIVFFVGSVLLVLHRKAATVWIAIHIPLAITYLASRYGVAAISPFWWFGYVCEALIVCFCVRLGIRGALK